MLSLVSLSYGEYMPALSEHANVERAAVRTLREKGFDVWVVHRDAGESKWWAQRDGWDFVGDSAVGLLGVVAIFEWRKPIRCVEYWWRDAEREPPVSTEAPAYVSVIYAKDMRIMMPGWGRWEFDVDGRWAFASDETGPRRGSDGRWAFLADEDVVCCGAVDGGFGSHEATWIDPRGWALRVGAGAGVFRFDGGSGEVERVDVGADARPGRFRSLRDEVLFVSDRDLWCVSAEGRPRWVKSIPEGFELASVEGGKLCFRSKELRFVDLDEVDSESGHE